MKMIKKGVSSKPFNKNVEQQKHSCAVIGSGVAGLSAAIRMAVKGYKVTVFEQSSKVGGKISEKWLKDFRFDTGPSLFTLPELVDELFFLCGKEPRQHFRYSALEASCKYFWEDGTRLTAWSDHEQFAREVEQRTGLPAGRIRRFLSHCRRLYLITSEVFMFNSLHRVSNYFKPYFMRSMLQLHRLDAFTSMHRRNLRALRHPKIVQLFDRYATYNGSSPYVTPATLNVIAHLEHNLGAWFPEKGMYSIAASLQQLAMEMGVEFRFNTPVEKIILQDGDSHATAGSKSWLGKLFPTKKKKKISGLIANGETHDFDMVISNVDVVTLYSKLLPEERFPEKQLRHERSTSALIFYWGVDRGFPELGLHNILFSENYEEEFDHLFRRKTISDDPTVYLFISAREVSGDAPAGKENWYVMINAPENVGQDWDAMVKEARRHIIGKINRMLGTDIERHIEVEDMADPRSIERDTGSFRGSLYGLSSNGRFAAFNRHPNFKKKYRNLYFSGGSVHPGGGIPLCLASAKIVDKEVKALSVKG